MSTRKTAVPASASAKKPIERVYKDNIMFDHDLFRLENETMTKNINWNRKAKPIWEPFEHKHFFHTFDSDGRKQTRCVPAVGHFHPMEVQFDGDGKILSIECGPAMKEIVAADEEGVVRKQSVPLTGREQHSHKVTYVASEKLQTRKANENAVQAQAEIIGKQSVDFSDDERKAIKENAGQRATGGPKDLVTD